jgi:hypothetical protein
LPQDVAGLIVANNNRVSAIGFVKFINKGDSGESQKPEADRNSQRDRANGGKNNPKL